MRNWLFAASLCIAVLVSSAPVFSQGLLLNGEQQFIDANGAPLAGGEVYFYVPNTTTPKTTYQNYAETVPNTNPVILNSAGRAIIWGTGLYRQVVYDQYGNLIWDQQTYAPPTPDSAVTSSFGTQTTIASATTTNLGTITTNNALITGTSTIASFGSSASLSTPVYLVTFQNALTLTYNATSMVLPGGRSIDTHAGDAALFEYLGIGNWKMVSWMPNNNDPVSQGFGAGSTLAAAATTDLGTAVGNTPLISGSGVSITSFGSSASTQKPVYSVRFSGANTLVHNDPQLVLPGNANITTANGDSLLAIYNGSGNWKVLSYTTQAASPLPSLQSSVYLSSSSTNFVIPAGFKTSQVLELTCVGPGGGGGSTSGGAGGGGGGGGAGGVQVLEVTGFTAGTDLAVTVGASGGIGSTNSGSNGGNGSGSTTFSYNGVTFMTCGAGTGGTSGTAASTNLPGGAGGSVSTNFPGSGLTLNGTILSYAGQTGGTGRYQGSNVAASGAGGGSIYGQGGPPAYSVSGGIAAGLDGTGYGAGGSGGAAGSGTQTTGGSGTAGIAIIKGVY